MIIFLTPKIKIYFFYARNLKLKPDFVEFTLFFFFCLNLPVPWGVITMLLSCCIAATKRYKHAAISTRLTSSFIRAFLSSAVTHGQKSLHNYYNTAGVSSKYCKVAAGLTIVT